MPETAAVQEEPNGQPRFIAASGIEPTFIHVFARTVADDSSAISERIPVDCWVAPGCLPAYCLVAPNVYEATARVALRGALFRCWRQIATRLHHLVPSRPGQVQLETLANMFSQRSARLGWSLLVSSSTDAGIYRLIRAKFSRISMRDQPDPQGRAWLAREFQRDLTVQTIPRTLVLQIRFRSHDAALSAAVVNALIEAYQPTGRQMRALRPRKMRRTRLNAQLDEFKTRADRR